MMKRTSGMPTSTVETQEMKFPVDLKSRSVVARLNHTKSVGEKMGMT